MLSVFRYTLSGRLSRIIKFYTSFAPNIYLVHFFHIDRSIVTSQWQDLRLPRKKDTMAIDHFHLSLWRGTLAFLLLLSHLGTVPSLFAAPLQPPDDSRRLYDRVMEEFRHKDYDAALAGFRFFLALHRQSALSANAQYWMGECQYRMGHFKDALESFYNVISYYPLSQKLAASTLKIGQIHARQGDRENAQLMYERVMEQYPNSAEADVARKALETAATRSDPVAPEPS